MLTIAGGVIVGVLGLVALARIVSWWSARGGTLIGGLALLLTIAVAGAASLWMLAVYVTNADTAKWQASQRAAAVAQAAADRVRLTEQHAAWCATWAGIAVPDSACGQWTVDTAPPVALGAVVREHARRRLADTLAAARELTTLERAVAATRVEVADILPAWDRWGRVHPSADGFGRFQAAALVREACGLGQPHHGSVEADLRSMSDHTEWCFRSWWADSTIFAAQAPAGSR